MTTAMWFVWMLRGDIRGTASVQDDDGQRDFVCWWLCYGEAEYPAVWAYGSDQLAVAQECPGPLGLPRLLAFIVRCRADLAERFTRSGVLDIVSLLCWYRVVAPSELPVAPALPDHLVALTEQPCSISPWHDHGTEVPHIAADLWQRTPHLQALWPAHDPVARGALRAWFFKTGRHLLPRPSPLPPLACRPLPQRTAYPSHLGFGVNLVGYPRGELGIGEDVRMLSAALTSARVQHAIIDVPFGPLARREDDTVTAPIRDSLDYPVTIFCLTAFDTVDLYLRRGAGFFSTAYRIGNWPWELPRFPDAWSDAYALVDEVWAASRYARNAYKASAKAKPVHLMPPAVAVGAIRPTKWRQMLPDPGAFTFLVPFDPHSTFRRKNPIAAVRAFRSAFDHEDRSVALVLRINGDPAGQPGWPELQESVAGDARIQCMTQTLDRAEALGIMQNADCLVSPHRAEGYGRNIAEAKLLGTPVLATGFSGNVDFTAQDEAIAWRKARLRLGEYPHADGLWWAEPDIEHLATRMREVRGAAPSRRSAREIKVASAQSLQQAGQRYATRIAEVVRLLQRGHDTRPA